MRCAATDFQNAGSERPTWAAARSAGSSGSEGMVDNWCLPEYRLETNDIQHGWTRVLWRFRVADVNAKYRPSICILLRYKLTWK